MDERFALNTSNFSNTLYGNWIAKEVLPTSTSLTAAPLYLMPVKWGTCNVYLRTLGCFRTQSSEEDKKAEIP